MVGSCPRSLATSPRFFPASDSSQSQRARTTFFGSPPPRSFRISRAASVLIFARVPGSLQAAHHLIDAAFLGPGRKQRRLNPGARRGIGILIDRGIHASGSRFIDQPQRLDALPQVRRTDHLVMRHLRRQPAAFTDRDGLFHAVDDRRRLVAHVRDIDAAEPAGHFRELDDLARRGERARHVEEAGAQAERAVLHRLFDERPHPVQLARGGRSIGRADHGRPNRSLADEASDVHRLLEQLQARQKRRERNRRAPVRALHQGRDALTHVVVGRRHAVETAPGVTVDVDEAGRDDLAAHVDDARGRVRDGWCDADDRVSLDGHVGAVPGIAASVHDPAVPQHELIRRRLCARRQDDQGAGDRGRRRRRQMPRHAGARCVSTVAERHMTRRISRLPVIHRSV